MEHLLEPMEGPLIKHSAPTEGSLFAEELLTTFIRYGASMAVVRWEDTPYGLRELYDLCRRACRKEAFKRHVSAHKDGERLVLVRERSR